MLKNKIKAIKIGFLIFCILPTISYGLDKEDLLKFLVKSSYPEVKVIDKEESKENSEEENKEENIYNKEDEDKSNVSNESEEEYVKIHVGEENAPNLENEDKETLSLDSNYQNNLRVTKDNPKMLIYHTHGSETYSEQPKDNYHSTDKASSVIAVGDALTTELNNKGWGVVHSTTHNDLSYNKSYQTSFNTAQSILSQYESVDIAIDLHRNGLTIKDETTKKSMHEKDTTEINGETVAKFFFVVGQRNQNVAELKKEADKITALAQEKYPGIVGGVVMKEYGRFNQYIADNCLLVEVGSNATSIKESKATTKYLAEILDEYYRDKK